MESPRRIEARRRFPGERQPVEIRHRIWFEVEGGAVFGPGRAALLRAIDELGSLSAAARLLGMSYRAAWGRLRESEERLGMKLADVDEEHQGMRLTPNARKLLEEFESVEREIAAIVERHQID